MMEAIDRTLTAHMTLTGKGGCGKSFLAWLIAQYLRDREVKVTCIDTDPINPILGTYTSLGTITLPLRKSAESGIEPGDLSELFAVFEHASQTISGDLHFVIDVGSVAYLPMLEYLSAGHGLEILDGFGVQLVIHAPVAGAEYLQFNISALREMTEKFAGLGVDFVAYINPHFSRKDDPVLPPGMTLQQLIPRHDTLRVIELPRLAESTELKYIRDLQSRGLIMADVGEPQLNFDSYTKMLVPLISRKLYRSLTALDELLDGTAHHAA